MSFPLISGCRKKEVTHSEIELHILRFLCNYDRVAIDVGANKGNMFLKCLNTQRELSVLS